MVRGEVDTVSGLSETVAVFPLIDTLFDLGGLLAKVPVVNVKELPEKV